MYRLLLVDDESDIREGLQEVVDFASYGFEVVGESTNGLEAVQACEWLEPDLVNGYPHALDGWINHVPPGTKDAAHHTLYHSQRL